MAVPADRDDESVREFKSFTDDLERLADWLVASRDRHGGQVESTASIGYRSSNSFGIMVPEILDQSPIYVKNQTLVHLSFDLWSMNFRLLDRPRPVRADVGNNWIPDANMSNLS